MKVALVDEIRFCASLEDSKHLYILMYCQKSNYTESSPLEFLMENLVKHAPVKEGKVIIQQLREMASNLEKAYKLD